VFFDINKSLRKDLLGLHPSYAFHVFSKASKQENKQSTVQN